MNTDKQQASVFDYRPDDMVAEKIAAEITGMSEQFLRQSRIDGIRRSRTAGPPYHKIGRSIRYKISDLTAWLDSRRIDPSVVQGDAA